MFKSGNHVPELLEYLNDLASGIHGKLSATFVIDGNIDYTTESLLEYLNEKKLWEWKIIQLSRNFGVGPALMAAFENSSSCISVAFGADLQEPKELFIDFQNEMTNSEIHVTLGVRRTRNDPISTKIFSNVYWALYKRFISPGTPKGGFDVCALSMNAKKSIIQMKEKNTNITAQIDWLGFKRKFIEFDRRKRSQGKSSWSMGRKVRLFFDSFYGFTDLPIRVMQFSSAAATALLTFLGLVTGISWKLGKIHVPGYSTIIFVQLFTANLIIFCISIIAGYVTRTFDNSKMRPTYLIEKILIST